MPEHKKVVLILLLVAALSFAVPAAVSQNSSEETVTVPAKSNIYASGRDKVPSLGGGGGVMPVEIDVSGIEEVTFPSVTGEIDSGIGGKGPEGMKFEGLITNITSYEGISGIVHHDKSFFLGGVFLSDSGPPESAPERMNFTNNDNFKSLSPKIGQVFYIGNGKTDSGQVQKFKVPDGATKLYLGIPDAGFFKGEPGTYGDNTGNMTVTYELSQQASDGGDGSDGGGGNGLPGFSVGLAIMGVIGASYILMRKN